MSVNSFFKQRFLSLKKLPKNFCEQFERAFNKLKWVLRVVGKIQNDKLLFTGLETETLCVMIYIKV